VAISDGVKWVEGTNTSSEGTVIFPSWKNPKKAIVQAAHIMMVLGSSA